MAKLYSFLHHTMLPFTFTGVTLLAFILFFIGMNNDRRLLLIYPVWLILVSILAYQGFFRVTSVVPPRLLFVLLPASVFVVYYYQTANVSARNVPYLLSIHVLRIPVELTLYQLYQQGQVPQAMTFAGWNYDVISGLSALLLLVYVLVTKREVPAGLFRFWNWLGLILLAIIVVTAILSAPSPIQQLAFDQPNVAILSFPYTLLPAVVVPTVLLAHLLCLKRMGTSA